MKYKVGDRVRIKSLDWYNQMLAIKDKHAHRTASNGCEFIGVWCGNRIFKNDMIKFCGQVMTIKAIENEYYIMHEDTSGYWYCDEMIEGLVEEETKPEPKFKVGDILFYRGETSGYLKVEEIREENGEIRYYETSRNIYLVENDPDVFADKVCSVETEETKSEDELLDDYEELTDRAFKGGYEKCKSDIELNGFQLPDGYIFKDENGNVINTTKIILEKKKKEYPKTYEECSLINGCEDRIPLKIIGEFTKLINARNAYWKLAGEEMGLGKPWEPDWSNPEQLKHTIYYYKGDIKKDYWHCHGHILAFPTEEMMEEFHENFKKEIEICKELL